jgi:soluble lytic murein transglycosylase-like protein
MRSYEFLTEQQLEELNLKKALATGAFALAAGASMTPGINSLKKQADAPRAEASVKQLDPEVQKLTKDVLKKYKIDPAVAANIVELVKKHEDPVFPKAKDLLAIIGIESSFNSKAVSGLKKDPALGLTQIRPGVWGLNPSELSQDIEKQISKSSEILSKYNAKLKDPKKAVHAYNIGLTAFLKGRENIKYVDKFEKERTLYK